MSEITMRQSFSNVSNGEALSIDEMLDHLKSVTGDRLRHVGGGVCYIDGHELRPIASAAELLAWMDGHVTVFWSRRGVSRDVFFEGVRQRLPRFAWATYYPHFPPIPGVLYLCEIPTARQTGALDALIDRFRPATAEDRTLLKAFICTLCWGGPPGKRPLYVFTGVPDDLKRGRGTGKTALCRAVLPAGRRGCVHPPPPGPRPPAHRAALPIRPAAAGRLARQLEVVAFFER
jgi:hypothetical protein